MKINKDPKTWQRVKKEVASNAICVKRSDVNVSKTSRAHGILAQPAILQGEVKNDDRLFDYVRIFASGAPVTVVGHGWNSTEQFVATMSVKEFIERWQGD